MVGFALQLLLFLKKVYLNKRLANPRAAIDAKTKN
jgi:hypothetical protein